MSSGGRHQAARSPPARDTHSWAKLTILADPACGVLDQRGHASAHSWPPRARAPSTRWARCVLAARCVRDCFVQERARAEKSAARARERREHKQAHKSDDPHALNA